MKGPAGMSGDYGPPSGSDLVERTKAGDNRGFDELVRRYRDRVYRLCFKILRHEQDAAEALQDAFLSAYRGLPRFKAESTFSTWLYRIATNASLMKLRRRREGHVSYEQSQSPVEDAEPMAIADWSAQPLDELLDAEVRELVGREIAQLPENERTVFVLRDLMEQTNADVARELGITVAAVKSRLHRARVHLRDRMNRYFRERTARRGRGAP